jgi:hypothetical protein
MKLDRNTNPDGQGKYALVHLRRLKDLPEGKPGDAGLECAAAIKLLKDNGILTLGNEAPHEQFFVMKYGDAFTAGGLLGYASGVRLKVQEVLREWNSALQLEGAERALKLSEIDKMVTSLVEYAQQIEREGVAACHILTKIPD